MKIEGEPSDKSMTSVTELSEKKERKIDFSDVPRRKDGFMPSARRSAQSFARSILHFYHQKSS